MRTKPFKYTVAQMVEAVRKNRGFLYLTARSLGCHHSTVLDYRRRHPEIDDAFKSERGEMVDTAELALFNAILAGEAWAVCFTLKCLGKDRGYVERLEMHHGGEINHTVEALTVEQRRERFLAKLGESAPPGRVGTGGNGSVDHGNRIGHANGNGALPK